MNQAVQEFFFPLMTFQILRSRWVQRNIILRKGDS